jgi:coenzyme F420 hydrogenase subunit beta
MAAQYVKLEPVGISAVRAAQPNQIQRHQVLLGRLLVMRLLLVPVPKFVGFSLFNTWSELPFLRKARTILGTLKRVVLRGLWRRRPLSPA